MSPRVISISSGKGGVGKTLVGVSLADYAARQGMRTLLVDADLGLANADLMLGVAPRACCDALLEGRASLDEVITPVSKGLDLLSGGSGLHHLVHLPGAQQRVLLDALQEAAARYELVVVDVAAGIGENVLFFVSLSQLAVIVLTPEPTSLTDAYALIKVLSRERGVRHFAVVVNQADDFDARLAFRRLLAVSDRYLDVVLDYIGHLPAHDAVRTAVQRHEPPSRRAPSWFAQRLDDLCAAILSRPSQHQGVNWFWERALTEALEASASEEDAQ